jgi:bifunctional non-homologous end joining protein LigD
MTEQSTLLPQRARRVEGVVESAVDWLFEPYWSGDRLLARLEDGRISLTDATGESADDAFPEVAGVLGDAIDADAAVIDGVWTAQPFIGNGQELRRRAQALVDDGLLDEPPDPTELETRRAFVALDLVELDGASLQQVPYAERRRLLESVVQENGRVRVSPAVRVPIQPWLVAWRNDGFAFYVAKHANSRYHPGEVAEDWLVLRTQADKAPTPRRGLFGGRRGRPGTSG